MPYQCPQCGGVFTEDASCSDRFWAAQQIELEQPDYYAVHQLSVPAYYLQHNLYSRYGWLYVRKLLGEFIYEGLTPQYARTKIRDQVDSGNRSQSLTRGEKLAEVESVTWHFTMADVRLDIAENYCADVRRWAESVYTDSAAMVTSLTPK